MALGIHFDLDSVDVQQSLGDLRLLVMALCQGHRYLIDDLYIWFTGGRGFHVLAKKSFGLSTDTPAKVKRDAESIAGNIKTWDSSVYDRTRLWRVPNSKHGKTGLYKIPLLASEVFCLSMDGIKTLAKKQRSIQDACDDVVVRLRSNAK
jgi:DNA primase catalytic subunit